MSQLVRHCCLLLSIVALIVFPSMADADSMSGVGDLVINTLDADAQKILAANGVLGANQISNARITDCADKAKTAEVNFRRGMATALTSADPVKKLHDGINACLQKIKDISNAIELPSGFSFTQLLSKILKQLTDKIVDDIIMKICTTATNTWNSAVNNAVDTLNTGINQSGVNTFGDFVSVSASPAPASSAPLYVAPLAKPSSIPGL